MVHRPRRGLGARIHAPPDRPASGRAVHRQPPRHHVPPLRPALSLASPADPDGPAYGIALAWSGSWRLLADAFPFRDRVRVAGGIDDESTVLRLEPGETFTTPPTLGVYAPDGRGRCPASLARLPARLARPRPRPCTAPDRLQLLVRHQRSMSSLDHQLALADRAAELGAEAFVVDDGWFAGRTATGAVSATGGRTRSGFPDGLDPLISGVLARRPALRHLGRAGGRESRRRHACRPSRLDLPRGRQATGHRAQPVRPRLRPT